MRLSLGLDVRQVQKQILAPRMIQSMEILQLSVMALQDRIEQELNENPLLEIQQIDPALPDEPAEERENPDAPTEDEKELVVVEDKNNIDDFERLVNLDRDAPNHFDEEPRRSAGRMEEEANRKHDAMANLVCKPESLNDYLLHQLGELDIEPELADFAVKIVSSLDSKDGGYFRASLEDLLTPGADSQQLALAKRSLELVQSLDPPGVAARDLKECLLLQLTEHSPHYEEVKILITNHLEDLRDNRMPVIERATGWSIEAINEAWDQLRKLNPKPSSAFNETFVPTVTPDVSIETTDDGSYKIVLEDDRTPTLYISEYYRKRLQSKDITPEEREFIKRKVNAAQWLIESIEQRRSTLTRVSQAIVDHQRKFLDEGPEFIEPLKMQQIADKVGVHVTTVSRAVDDKWIQTPRGILPLKRFFVGGTQSDSGEDIAWDKIRLRLQELVDEEDKQKPYSDDELVKELKKHGLNVARRTVTKYRQKMDIPSSRKRRDWSKK